MNKKKIIPSIIVIIILVAALTVVGYITTENSRKKALEDANATEATETTDAAVAGLNLISGGYSFFPDDILPDDADASEYALPAVVGTIPLPCEVADTPFVIRRIARYTGPFYEDGQDEQVEDVLAIIVENTSNDFLLSGQIVLKINDTEEAVFNFNTMPANTRCLVIDKNKHKFSADDVFTYYSDDENNYCHTLTDDEVKEFNLIDKVTFTYENSKLTLNNATYNNFGTLYARYKNFQEGVYLGGITYSVKFEDVSGLTNISKKANHFTQENSEVIIVEKEPTEE